jgi:protein gp37
MRQSAWLKRLARMVRARCRLVKLSNSCAFVSRNQTSQADRIDQLDQLSAARREMLVGEVRHSFC